MPYYLYQQKLLVWHAILLIPTKIIGVHAILLIPTKIIGVADAVTLSTPMRRQKKNSHPKYEQASFKTRWKKGRCWLLAISSFHKVFQSFQ